MDVKNETLWHLNRTIIIDIYIKNPLYFQKINEKYFFVQKNVLRNYTINIKFVFYLLSFNSIEEFFIAFV